MSTSVTIVKKVSGVNKNKANDHGDEVKHKNKNNDNQQVDIKDDGCNADLKADEKVSFDSGTKNFEKCEVEHKLSDSSSTNFFDVNISNDCKKVIGVKNKVNDHGVKRKNKNNNDQQVDVKDDGCNADLKADEKDNNGQVITTDSHHSENIIKISETSDPENTELHLSKLRQPLEKGWRRETIISCISRNFEVRGTVRYYAPGSQVELKDIGQIQTILVKQSQASILTVDHFSFSPRPIVGTFLQPYSSSSDIKYYYTSDAQMAKHLKEHRHLKSKSRKRKKHTTDDGSSEMNDEGECMVDVSANTDTIPTTGNQELRLFKIDDSENYYDEKGFLYSKNNSKQVKNSYFRCKNSKRYRCHARVKASENNLEKCILTWKHSHLPHPGKVDKEKFDKQLNKACEESPYSLPRELYAKTRKQMKAKVDPLNIPLKGKYDTLIHRKRRKYIPKLPKSVNEFEDLIQNYKEQYLYDERNLPFYRDVWKTKAGESNVVFISESVLNKLREIKVNIHMLMDGTFKVLPRHIKFRQLYIISIIYEDRCYPLAFILMEKKTFYSYKLIFSKLKLLFPSCEITNFMADYEAATRKALKNQFPLARISGCYFHYVKAINKASRRFGLSKDVKFETAIQKVSALALLPNEFISKGFKIIDEENRNFKYSLRWDRFKKYWCRQWKKANISVYGLRNRTNNFAESMNKSLNVLAKVKGPNIWILIEHLKTLEMDKTDELNQHSEGLMVKPPKPTGEMKRLDEKIVEATKIFKEKHDVARFLRNVIHGDKLENFFKERIYFDGIDDYDYYEDSGFEENEEEDFIPNDFNPNSNFFLQPNDTVCGKRKAEEKRQTCKSRRVR